MNLNLITWLCILGLCGSAIGKKENKEKIALRNKMKIFKQAEGRMIGRITTINQLANVFFDYFPQIVKILELEPFKVGNQSQKIATATISLTNIVVHHIDSLKRNGDLIITNDNETELMAVIPDMIFKKLTVVADYKATVNLIFPISLSGTVTADVTDVLTKAKLLLNFQTFNATADKPDITINSNLIHVKVSNTILPTITSTVLTAMTSLLKAVIVGVIETIVGKKLNEALGLIMESIRENAQSFG